MDQKPTMMNTEWDKHLQRIDLLFHRLNDLEDRLFALEHPEDELEEYSDVTPESYRLKVLEAFGNNE